MQLQESGEMYLESILILTRTGQRVLAVDVSEYMGFTKASVSRAMANLRESGYIYLEDNGTINLTEQGKSVAEKILERHMLLTQYLQKIGVPEDIAKEDACRIEHVISDESFAALKNHVESHK